MTDNIEFQASPSQPGHEVTTREVPSWKSALSEMQAAAPRQLKPVFSSKIPPERSLFLEKQTRPDVSVSTGTQVITASRADYHRTSPAYSIIALTLKGLITEALVVTTPNPDAPTGSVVYKRFTTETSKGLELDPKDKEFAGAKDKLLGIIKGATR